jgi:hypothetical protein
MGSHTVALDAYEEDQSERRSCHIQALGTQAHLPGHDFSDAV